MEHLFLEILANEAQKGNKPSKTFVVSINRVVAAISERFQVQCDVKHVENHLRIVKNQWQIICTIQAESGFGWDDNIKMITCDRSTYDAIVMIIYLYMLNIFQHCIFLLVILIVYNIQ
ncbi:hypothetical protein Gogos_006105 [Gossypium gossypioides]|uniref:Myb/SANT-like domain-containing protein n=1 Tax=Gossypium gossypioides TaxID=34282 RepID=A0A7J9C5A2_GOSGO|nr:hypothetical protein [Gossypium gossypioides]